jgi:THO complex subunit 3
MLNLPYDSSIPFTLNGHTSSCLSVEMQQTGRHLATGGSDSIIALWDTTDWICQRTLIDMVGPVRSISFSFDGSYIVGGSDEGAGLEIAHVETGEYVHSVKTAGPCPVVAWHPSKYLLAYTDLGSLKIIGVDSDRR